MAQKAKKELAKANASALNNLHIGSVVANAVFFQFHLFFNSRSLFWYFIFSIPALICEFVLENAGRPKYDPSGALKTSGEDLGAAGLTEYMFDVVWVTWASLAAVILFGNWGWFLWLVLPAYGIYTGYGLLGAGKKMAQMQATNNEAAPAGNRKQRRAAA